MCLLTTSTLSTLKRVFLDTTGLIDDVYDSNSDGLGVMYFDGAKLHVQKVLPKNAHEARQFIESLPDGEHMIACHWRMKTHGLIDMANCHPYEVNPTTYLAHNGILHTGNDADKEKSDTWHFIKDYLSTLDNDVLHNEQFLEMLGEFIQNNRFAIMSSDGRLSVVNRDQGIESHGVWFSNTYAWNPALLIDGYRSKVNYYWPQEERYDWLRDLDEDEGFDDDRDGISASVYYALDSLDEDSLGELLRTEPAMTIATILDEFVADPLHNDLPPFDKRIVQAWCEGDEQYLMSKARIHHRQLAQALLYYCEIEWIGAELHTE